MNFIFVSLQRFGTDRESTSTSLARELSKKHNVLYVNPPLDRNTLHRKDNDRYIDEHISLVKNRKPNLLKIHESLHVLYPVRVLESINWIPFKSIFRYLNKINNRRFSKDIQLAIEDVGFQSFVIINDKDIFRSFHLKELLKPRLYIYLDRDNTVAVKYWKKHGAAMEPLLMAKSDLVVCNSPTFTKRALAYNKNSHYIGNGCGLDVFSDPQVMNNTSLTLQNINKPIIGFVGALNSFRLDLPLIIELAKSKVDWSFVFIGPDDSDFRESQLYQLPNVHYLGKVDAREVPAYVNAFDVCLNPQLVNEITDGNFPLKIVEYLALGKATVATATTTMKEIFVDFTYLGLTNADYISMITLALEEDCDELRTKRQLFARQFGWDKIVENLMSTIEITNKGAIDSIRTSTRHI